MIWWRPMQKPLDSYERIALEFEVSVYETGRTLFPGNARVLDSLAISRCALGRYRQALQTLDELIDLQPGNPRFLYNRACVQSCLGETSGALEDLRRAVESGFDDFEFMTGDPDLEPLRETPQFREYRKRALIQRVGKAG